MRTLPHCLAPWSDSGKGSGLLLGQLPRPQADGRENWSKYCEEKSIMASNAATDTFGNEDAWHGDTRGPLGWGAGPWLYTRVS